MNLVSAFTYDTRGNRTKETVTGDENYVMTNTYDANGNQTFKQTNTYSQGELMSVNAGNYTTGTVESFTYNLQNQLVNYQTSGTTASYEYGANGLRKKKVVNAIARSFVWNGSNLAAELSGSAILNVYNYGIDGIATRETSNGDVSVYVKNAHGDVVGLAGTNGNLTTNYQYDAFGNQLNNTTDTNPFRYCGEYYDSESGNIYLRARYYDSRTGRFINEDPAKDGVNWYAYCGNNPVMFIDPAGTHDIPLYDGDNVYDVRYDVRKLINLVGGVLKVEDNVVKIKALGNVSSVDLTFLSEQEKGMRAEDKHLVQDSLHYTLKEFLELIGADYKITTAQIEVTDNDVVVQKFEQCVGKGAVKLLQGSFESVMSATGIAGQAISSISSFLGYSWGGNYNEILTKGFYKKQFIEISDEHGKGIIVNHITKQHTTSNTLASCSKELWNADMNEMAFHGWQYP